MEVIVCEGRHDAIFLRKLTDSIGILSLPVNNCMKKLQRILLSSGYNYIKNKYGIIIYGDNGKSDVINKVLPRLVRDCFTKIKNLKILTILDQNGENEEKLVERVFNTLNDGLQARGVTNYNFQVNKATSIVSSTFDRGYDIVVELFIIPKSLEKQLIEKCLQVYNSKLSSSSKKKIQQNMDSLKQLANILGKDEEEIIDESIKFKWFDDEKWFINLMKYLGKHIWKE